MVDVVLTEHHDLLTVLHQSLRILMHTVHQDLVTEVFLHFCDIYDASVCQFLEFGIVDVCTVQGNYLIVVVMAWCKHERVVGSS